MNSRALYEKDNFPEEINPKYTLFQSFFGEKSILFEFAKKNHFTSGFPLVEVFKFIYASKTIG